MPLLHGEHRVLPRFTLLNLLLLASTVLPLWRHPHWLVRGMDFPRLQIACLAAVLLLVELIILDPVTPAHLILAGLTVFCLARQSWWILPYTLLWRREVKPAGQVHANSHISILTANVLMPNRNAGALLALGNRHLQLQ